MNAILDREEYIEQAYFFRAMRERLGDQRSAQDVLDSVHEEILATTRLPMAIQFLAAELKHTGLLGSGFARLGHYFTPFQAYAIQQCEKDTSRFTIQMALLLLEREAQYRAAGPTKPGLFVYQFEGLSRNRLGYDDGLIAMAGDPLFDAEWKTYLDQVRRKIGSVDFADLVYVRSEEYVVEQRRSDPEYQPPVTPLFGPKEGKIAKANRGRDPLYLFAALQRQLGYPEVPRPQERTDVQTKFDQIAVKLKEIEARLRLLESEVKGQVDLQLFGKPEILGGMPSDRAD
jgi:RNAse (barnase) inhibitor barstar